MRDRFIKTFTELAADDPNLMLLTGDLGFGVLDDFAKRFPRQYLNVGVAEQNLTGVAAGLALSGKHVFTYSIANFPILRCLEQVRNDVCYHELPVTVVEIGGGLSYGPLGFSHHATEDLAITRALPNMTVVAPGDDDEAEQATIALAALDSPAFLRLDRAAPRAAETLERTFELGQLSVVQDVQGADVLLLSTGAMLSNVVAAAADLSTRGIRSTVVSCHTVKPFDDVTLAALVAHCRRLIVTVEEHSVLGGLGAVVAETVTNPLSFTPTPVLRIGLPDVLPSAVGSQQYLRGEFGLSSDAIADRTARVLSGADLVR
jgi:transketolase